MSVISIKITNGYFRNITYNTNEEYFIKLDPIEFQLVRELESDDHLKYNRDKTKISEMLKEGIEMTYIGQSRIDKNPIFIFDIRDKKIDIILKN